MPAARLLTVADLEEMGSASERMELFDGVPREKPGEGMRHGEVVIALLIPLGSHVRAMERGQVYPSPTQFVIAHDPDTVVIPDLAFVQAARLRRKEDRWGIARDAPDLAGEVISPTDRYGDVMEKVERYHRAGVALVWLIVSRLETVVIHRLGAPPVTLDAGDILDGGDVLPDFRLPVADIFA